MRYITVKPRLEEEARGVLSSWEQASTRAYSHVATRLAHRPDLQGEAEVRKKIWATADLDVKYAQDALNDLPVPCPLEVLNPLEND